MGHTIMKPQRDVDFYAVYSSVVDSFIYWGSRAELEAEYEHAKPERFARADEMGSSCLWCSPPEFGWHDDTVSVREGVDTPKNAWALRVPRDRIAEFCNTYDHTDGKFHPPSDINEYDYFDD